MKYRRINMGSAWMVWLLGVVFLWGLGCSKAKEAPDGDHDPQAGYLTGVVKDQAGNPLSGVRILVDNSIFFNSNLSTHTDAQGRYKIKVPTGSWYAFASHQVTFWWSTVFVLSPSGKSGGFGGEGGVRNFVWKLSGTMPEPLSGTYGGLVTIDNEPGTYIEAQEIDFFFTPVGPLIDGSQGEVMSRRSLDGHTITDIPLGRYTLSAMYQGRSLKFKRWNSDEEFREHYDIQFSPQIHAQCDNCAKLVYDWEP